MCYSPTRACWVSHSKTRELHKAEFLLLACWLNVQTSAQAHLKNNQSSANICNQFLVSACAQSLFVIALYFFLSVFQNKAITQRFCGFSIFLVDMIFFLLNLVTDHRIPLASFFSQALCIPMSIIPFRCIILSMEKT